MEVIHTRCAYISNIQRFSVDDGPGIRTTVFFKGCNLKCRWCHNPECIPAHPSLQFVEKSCAGCGRCIEVCPREVHSIVGPRHLVKYTSCVACGKCVDACLSDALSIVGKVYDPDALLDILKKDMPYYARSGGGVTFSGGEPMLQLDYLQTMLQKCKESGLHTAVDTAGNVPYENFQQVMPYTDIFLYDIKLFDSEKHRDATAVPNERILSNLKQLTADGARVIVRTPVIMEINGDFKELEDIAGFLGSLSGIELVQLLPYHSYGVGKYETLGMTSKIKNHTPPAEAFLEEALALFLAKGLNATIS